MRRRPADGAVVAAARGLAVDGHEVGLLRPGVLDPSREGLREKVRIDPVHQDGQPATARHPAMVGQIASQDRQVGFAPLSDQVVVVAVADRAADHQEQHFRRGMRHLLGNTWVLDLSKMIEKRP